MLSKRNAFTRELKNSSNVTYLLHSLILPH